MVENIESNCLFAFSSVYCLRRGAEVLSAYHFQTFTLLSMRASPLWGTPFSHKDLYFVVIICIAIFSNPAIITSNWDPETDLLLNVLMSTLLHSGQQLLTTVQVMLIFGTLHFLFFHYSVWPITPVILNITHMFPCLSSSNRATQQRLILNQVSHPTSQ